MIFLRTPYNFLYNSSGNEFIQLYLPKNALLFERKQKRFPMYTFPSWFSFQCFKNITLLPPGSHSLCCNFCLFFFFFNLKTTSVITCGMLWTLTHYFAACPALRDCTFKSYLLQQQQVCVEVTAPPIANSPGSESLGDVWIKPQGSWSGAYTGK